MVHRYENFFSLFTNGDKPVCFLATESIMTQIFTCQILILFRADVESRYYMQFRIVLHKKFYFFKK